MYKRCIVIGFGKCACDCIRTVSKYISNVAALESEYNQLSLLKNVCEKNVIPYLAMSSKDQITAFLSTVEDDTLILSANNKYLFPKSIVQKINFNIVNFHNAYLPYYRGVNCPTWVIFNGEKTSGVTWHIVNEAIDDGKILIQRKIELVPDETGFTLTKKCIQLGTEIFETIAEDLVMKRIKGTVQENSDTTTMCYSSKIPNDGYIKLDDPLEKTFALLRSVDFGKYPMFPRLKVIYEGKCYFVNSYELANVEEHDQKIEFIEDCLTLYDVEKKLIIKLSAK